MLMVTTVTAQTPLGRLTVHTGQLRHALGKVVVCLYREQDELPKYPFRQESSVIVDGSSTVIFEDLPFGSYAAILYHDENNNGILDHKFLLPAEPMGFSNHWKLTLLSGMPDFQKLRFTFSEQSLTLSITTNN